jgi:fumarate reductase iron-sulfur subunit
MLCYAACPEYGLIPKYIGRRRSRSRTAITRIRATAAAAQEEIAATEGAWECSFTGACSEVCPEHVDPAGAIQQVKIRSTVDWYTEHLMPWLKK